MGALQVEVKILENAPLFFVWQNKQCNQVEGYLITCQCQNLGLQAATEDDMRNGGVFHGADEEWAANLAHALEISQVVSFSAIEMCASVGYGHDLVQTEGIDIEDDHDTCKRKKKKNAKKSPKEEKHIPQHSEEELFQKDVVVSLEDEVCVGRSGDSDEVLQEQEVATANAGGEQAQDELQSIMQKDVTIPVPSVEYSELKSDPGGSNMKNESSSVSDTDISNTDDHETCTADDLEESGSNERVTHSEPTGSEMNSVSKGSLNSSLDGNDGNQSSNFRKVLVHTEDASTGGNEECASGTPNSNQVSTDSAATVKDQTSIAHNTATKISVPGSEEEALMNAISSIMELYPGAVIDIPHVKLVERPVWKRQDKRDNPDFIRTLTEEERKSMFKFHSDAYEQNIKKIQEGGKFFLCEHCGKVVSTQRKKRHLAIHQPRTRNCTCDQCGKQFFDKNGLRHHMISHSSEPQFKCRYCSKSYRTVYGRTTHERAHFNVYAGECSRCGRKFRNNNKYIAHIAGECTGRLRRSAGQKIRKRGTSDKSETSTCEKCGKVLCSGSMAAHMSMHADTMFRCPICNKLVRDSSKSFHLKNHSEQRNYVCDLCHKSFKTSGVLKTHRMTHTGERPLKCRYCEKRFSRYNVRSVHETSHTGERPFPCTICKRGWKDRPTYMAHMKKHHPGTPVYYKRKSSMMNQLDAMARETRDAAETEQPQM